VGGGGGSPELAQPDFFATVGNTINDATNTVLSLPPEMLAAAIVIFFLGLIVLRRAI
jgi:hypothetical protein